MSRFTAVNQMPGRSRARAPTEKVGIRIPLGLYREMMSIVEAANRWPDPPRQNFILEAIKEKIERWGSEHSFGTPASRETPGTLGSPSGPRASGRSSARHEPR